MPLDSAIYDSVHDKIYGVRSGYVHQFNADTGALENSARFAAPLYGDSYICYEPITDRLFCTGWFNYANMDGGTTWKSKFIYKVIPTTLGVDTFYQFPASFFSSPLFADGPRQLFSAQGKIYGVFHRDGTSSDYLYEMDAASGAFTAGVPIGTFNDNFVKRADLVYDSGLDVFWVASANGADIWDRATVSGSAPNINLSGSDVPKGLAYRAPAMYFAVAEVGAVLQRYIRRKLADDTGPITSIDLSDPFAIPFNIKYNSVNDRIYVPTTLGDTVVIIDPNTDTVESTKTGFDSPWDVVFTPTKAWAVQHGPEGLKEIV